MVTQQKYRWQFVLSLVLATFISLGLYGYAVLRNHGLVYSFLPWNLLLAWLPLAAAVVLVRLLRTRLWSSWSALAASFVWLLLLPNSLYLVSDFVHLQDAPRADLIYDAVMFTSFIYTALILGLTSLYMVHLELKKRFSTPSATSFVAVILLLCSFAIYIGRELRWNSWDILLSPAGLIFDVSERILSPADYPDMFVTVIGFFALFGGMYLVAWQGIKFLKASPKA